MAFRKIEAGLVHAPVDEFIGKTGTIFYDNDLGDFRISDGATPGGIALSFGGGGGGTYTLPTATTTTKGGVKIDGSTITINNQVISVGTVPYSNLSGAPTIPSNTNQLTNGAGYITSSALSTYALSSSVPTNTNQLTNGAGYITSSALSGYATESYVTGRGYITTSALSGYALTSAIPTNNNQLTNGSNYITSSALTGYATEAYVTGRGYITSSALTGLATESYVTSQGYITSSALTSYALTTAIPTDISELTDTQGLLGQGGGGGGTTYITNNVENPYSFSIAGDDSTLREISNGESIKITGAGGITVTTDDEGKVTITGTTVDLTGYATESYVTSQGYITSSALTGYALTGDIPTDNNQLTNGSGYITSSALTGLATESYVTSRGYITGLSWNDVSDKPDLAATYSWTIEGDDSTLREINTGDIVKFIGAGGVTTASNADGNIVITSAPGIIVSAAAPTDPLAKQWYNSVDGRTYVKYNDLWVDANPPVVPEVSTYLDGLVVEGTTITTVSYTDTDIKINDLTFTANGVIQLPEGGDIVDSTGASVLGGTSGPSDRLVAGDNSVILGTDGSLTIPGDLINPDGFILNAGGRGSLAIGKFIEVPGVNEHFHIAFPDSNVEVPYQDLYLGNDSNYFKIRGSHNDQTMGVDIGVEGQRWEFTPNGVITLPNGSTIGDGDAVFGVPITTTRGTIFLGNQAECLGGENHFHIMKAGQQEIDLFLGDDNNYVKLPSSGGVEISSSEIGSQYYWKFGTDGGLRFPDNTTQTTAWLGIYSWNDLADKPNLASTYTWSIAADDSTLREINTDETVKFIGAGGVTTASDSEGNITITGPSLSGLATESYVTSQGYITSTALTGLASETFVTSQGYITGLSWDQLTDKPNLAGTYSWSIAADDSSQLEIGTGNLVKIQGAGGITTALDADGNITVTGAPGIIVSATAPTDVLAKQWYNSTDGRTYVKYNDLWVDANPPVVPEVSTYLDGLVVEGTTVSTTEYNASITVQDVEFTADGRIQLPDGGDIVDSEGNSVLVDLTGLATEEFVNNALASAGVTISATAPTGLSNGALWYNSSTLELYVRYENQWVAASSSSSGSGDYNDLTNKPTNVSQFANDANYVSRDEVYAMILELTN